MSNGVFIGQSMIVFCLLGHHKYNPVLAFHTVVVDDKNSINKKILYHEESWTGHQCKCGKKKLEKHKYRAQSPGITQQAYDWLNDSPIKKKAEIFKLVKR